MKILKTIEKLAAITALIFTSTIANAKNIDYKATVETVGYAKNANYVKGYVFVDENLNGVFDRRERGLKNVMVSNGIDVVLTDRSGKYRLPAYKGMSVMITKPSGYDVPVDNNNIPQFFYHHLPEGSPELRFGGLQPTGPLPDKINFPLAKGKVKNTFKMIIIGDTQPYSNNEIGYVRDTLAKDLASMDLEQVEGLIVEGDVMGDDLDLFPRFKEIMSIANAPQYYVAGNHDLDFDAENDMHSFDTFKREWGPAYYSMDIGQVHFVTLDNVEYPCANYDGFHEFCDNSTNYNGYISKQQLAWLKKDLALVPKDKLVVLSMHIPLVSFVDATSNKHQTDNAGSLYRLLAGRKALALSGHTHTLEHFEPGEGARPDVEGVDIPQSPFPQIITGAGSGSWWSGDFDEDGIPMSFQRLGGKRGFMIFEFDGNSYMDNFKATGESPQKQITASFLSPAFTQWYSILLEWLRTGSEGTPPLNFNDLADTKIITLEEIVDTKLIANVWNGSSATRVKVRIDDGRPMKMVRTEETPDPYALKKQLAIYRYAAESLLGSERTQGFELFGGASFGPNSPRPGDEWMHADNSSHLWQINLPQDLSIGIHKAEIIAMDKYGRAYKETIVFEVREERPEPFFRSWRFEE